MEMTRGREDHLGIFVWCRVKVTVRITFFCHCLQSAARQLCIRWWRFGSKCEVQLRLLADGSPHIAASTRRLVTGHGTGTRRRVARQGRQSSQ